MAPMKMEGMEMTTFTVKFDTDNAAFEGLLLRQECARILRDIAVKVEDGEGGQFWETILDFNGNDVGRWKLQERPGT
jgi:hypothetical protein